MPRLPAVPQVRHIAGNIGILVAMALTGTLIVAAFTRWTVMSWVLSLASYCTPQYDFGSLPTAAYGRLPCNPTIGVLPLAMWLLMSLMGGCLAIVAALHVLEHRVAKAEGITFKKRHGHPALKRYDRYHQRVRIGMVFIALALTLVAGILLAYMG
jgi:hypothetical protein